MSFPSITVLSAGAGNFTVTFAADWPGVAPATSLFVVQLGDAFQVPTQPPITQGPHATIPASARV